MSNEPTVVIVQPGANPTCPGNGEVIARPAPAKVNPAAAQPIKTNVKV
jgi:hypothetical protein